MADEIENEDDTLELGDAPEDTQPAADGEDTVVTEDDDIEIPTFGDPGEEEAGDTDLVKHLRQQLRERDKRLSEVEKGQKQPEIVVGDEPTLEDPDVDWDPDKFKDKYSAWLERKRQVEAKANEGQEAARKEQEAWQAELSRYAEKRKALPYRDVDDAEATVTAALSQAQQALIVKTANDPAKLIYALGKNPAKLAALAGVTDPVKFIAASVRLEGEVKMAKRKPAAQPERIVQGAASMVNAGANDLEKAIDKAVAKNDFNEVRRLRKLQRQKAA